MSPEREWWLRVPAVLLGPRAVFVALRDGSQEQVDARQEPVLALVYLAGIAAVLSTSTAGRLLDDAEYDGLLVAVWAVVAGGLYAFAGYWLIGGALYLGARGLGGLGDYRRGRHVLAFALAPLALSLLVLWPVQLIAFGGDLFRRGGSDSGAAGTVFDVLELGVRRLVGGAPARRRARRARLELGARARRTRAGRALPSCVRVPPVDLLATARRAPAPPRASSRCAAPRGSGARAPRRRRPRPRARSPWPGRRTA